MVAEKSRAFSPHGEAKKQALGPDDLRTSSLGRPVLSPYPMSPRDMAKISHDQHLLHFNCESSPVLPVCLHNNSRNMCLCLTKSVRLVAEMTPEAPINIKPNHLSSSPAFQQAGHPSLPTLPQDGGRLAAVRPLTMPEPPPLISSSKPGGSITQVKLHTNEN